MATPHVRVAVLATDIGNLAATHRTHSEVTDVNETPMITSGPATISKGENTATTEVIATYVAEDPDATTGTMTWDLQGNDAGDFTITTVVNGTAVLRFAASPDFEAPADTGTNNVYDLTVRVRDNASPRLEDTQAGSHAPTCGARSSAGTHADLREIDLDSMLDADLRPTVPGHSPNDAGGSPALAAQTPTISPITEQDGRAHSFKNPTPTPRQPALREPGDGRLHMMGGSTNEYVIIVEATDDNTDVAPNNQKGTFMVTVTVTNVDETPEITTDGMSHTAPSKMETEYDNPGGRILTVAQYMARDEEGQTITWSMSGADEGDFTLGSASGFLTFRQPPNFERPVDADSDNVYHLTVTHRHRLEQRDIEPITVTT